MKANNNQTNAQKKLGKLPVWKLKDLYSSQNDKNLSADLNNIKKDVVIVGGGTLYPKFNQYIIETLNFYDLNGIVPEDALYAGCYGALILSGNLNG